MNVKPVPGPNRRKTVRREEDVLKIRRIEALEALLNGAICEVGPPISAAGKFVEDLEDLELLEALRKERGETEEAATENHQTTKERRKAFLVRLRHSIKRVQKVLDHMEEGQGKV